jgi:N-methylhydantoinase B
MAAGEVVTDLLKVIVSNTRDPVERELDLRVQVATNARGAEAVKALIRRQGLDAVHRAMNDVIAYTRKRIGNRIAELDEGEHSFTSHLDDDGMGGDPVPDQGDGARRERPTAFRFRRARARRHAARSTFRSTR